MVIKSGTSLWTRMSVFQLVGRVVGWFRTLLSERACFSYYARNPCMSPYCTRFKFAISVGFFIFLNKRVFLSFLKTPEDIKYKYKSALHLLHLFVSALCKCQTKHFHSFNTTKKAISEISAAYPGTGCPKFLDRFPNNLLMNVIRRE